jgi:hypothetical protein
MFRYILVSLFALQLFSCSHKTTNKEVLESKTSFVQDNFLYQGKYHWSFNIMGTKQKSYHQFFKDRIEYKMTGKVYSTDYSMKKLSFDKKNNKWIGMDDEGIIYVLFFKDYNNNSVQIYKHKCKKGIQEALEFQTPALNTTKDHGWNVFVSDENNQKEEVLQLSSEFKCGSNSLILSDSEVNWNNKIYTKMSFHKGERRWVGKHKDEYILLFLNALQKTDSLQISINTFTDLEKLYKTKYSMVDNWVKCE